MTRERVRERVGRGASQTTGLVFSQLPKALLSTELSPHTDSHVHKQLRYRAKVLLQESLVMQCSVLRVEV